MNRMFRKAIIRCCVLFSAWAFLTVHGEEPQKEDMPEKGKQAFMEAIRNMLPVTIYGRVTDQNGNAVAEADVCISWTRWPLLPSDERNTTDWVKTDGNGEFEFTCDRPYRAFVDVSKDGYESPRGSFGDLIVNRTSRDKPIVIPLRKKGETTFLVVFPVGDRSPDVLFHVERTNDVSRPFDIMSWKSGPGWKYSATTNADLRIDAAFDADKKCWNVAYSVTNGPGGIVLSDKMFYEAPADGYAPSVSLTVTNVYDWRRYLYMKSRVPAIYSRVLFEHGATVGTNPSLRVSCKVWVNPYGERSLEEDERVAETQWRTRKELTAESIQSLRSGRLPAKPDIEQRIKETDERVAREETEKERRHKEWLEQLKREKESKVK